MEEKHPQSPQPEAPRPDALEQKTEVLNRELEDEVLRTDADYNDSPSLDEDVDSSTPTGAEDDDPTASGTMDAVPADSPEEAAVQSKTAENKSVGGQERHLAPQESSLPAEDRTMPASHNLNRILDIELPVTVHFGSIRRPLAEVLKLGPGSLLELDRLANEPVVLKVNDKTFARGQVVDVDGYYGVKITEIVSTEERITSLGEIK